MGSNLALGAIELTALGLGIIHALEPGHGKSLMVATLFGSRNRWLDPLALACSTAFGHLIGILLFAILSFSLAHRIVPHELRTVIESSIGAMILIFGCWELIRLFRQNTARTTCCGCSSSHSRCNRGPITTTRYISGLGLLVGLVPCPSALALAASTATLDSLSKAMTVTCIFGLGTALALLTLGLAITHTSHRIGEIPIFDRICQIARFIAPLCLMALGLTLLVHTDIAHHHP